MKELLYYGILALSVASCVTPQGTQAKSRLELKFKTTLTSRINDKIETTTQERVYDPEKDNAICKKETFLYDSGNDRYLTLDYFECDADGNGAIDYRFAEDTTTKKPKTVTLSVNTNGTCYTQRMNEQKLSEVDCTTLKKYSEFEAGTLKAIPEVKNLKPIN